MQVFLDESWETAQKAWRMRINVAKGEIAKSSAELLVVPVLATDDVVAVVKKHFTTQLSERVKKAATAQQFVGKKGQVLFASAPEGSSADYVCVVGLGQKSDDLRESVRGMVGAAVQTAGKYGLRTVSVAMFGRELQKPESIEAAATAALLADYAFDAYKKKNSDRKLVELELLFPDGKALPAARKTVERAVAVGEGVTIARDLVNMPAHEMTPTRLAKAAEEIVKASNGVLKLKVLNRAECQKLGMGAYLAVAQGSDEEPKFLHLTYTSPRPSKKTIAVVGKGVTFDSGGLSLKPADGMMTMKCDMAGGAAVLGLFAALAQLKPRVHVHGIVAATENMPSGKAIRPGDVVRSMEGKTIEILNTDAEGRLTLADAVAYVRRENPEVIIDLATLTGACMVALGDSVAGLMTNTPALGKQLLGAAKRAGEKLWELPLETNYREMLTSDIADLKNITGTRYGGALTAGLFIQEFVGETAWAHMDIAGPAFAERPLAPYIGKGGTGYGVRTLVEFISELEGKK